MPLDFLFISAYRFTPSLFFFFIFSLYLYHEFCTFSHLGFTYTTYTAVKGNFLLVSYFDSKRGKKENLGCAIYMKEYTIMMYFANHMVWSNNQTF